MADKDFKVKNKLFVNGLSNASGVILATNNNLDSSTTLPTQYGGTGTTTSPNAGQIPYSSSGTNYAPTDLSSLTISSSGGSTITAASASTKGLIIKGATSQSANLQEWQNSGGNKSVWVDGNGQLETGYFFTNFGGGSYKNSGLITVNPANNIVPLVIAGAASQTASLQEWRNSSGTALAKIQPDGSIRSRYFGDMNDTTPYIDFSSNKLTINSRNASYVGLVVQGVASQAANLQEWQNSAGTVTARFTKDGEFFVTDAYVAYFSGASNYSATLNVQTAQPNYAGIVIRGKTSQTANLQQWQNSSGTVLSSFSSTGRLAINTTEDAGGRALYVVQPNGGYGAMFVGTGTVPNVSIYAASGGVGLLVSGVASQTADLQQWQNSAGTVNARIDAYGTFQNGTASGYGAWINVQPKLASDKGIIIRGAASQTANLQEWQNSSGTVLASISAAGNLTVQDLTVNGTTTTINSTTLTVDDKNIELASVASPTDTTADGAGITIKGATDKTFNWVQSTGAFTSSEPISTPALSVSGNSVSSNITLAAGKRYFVDTTSARTLTLPASPSLGDEIKIFDASGTAATNNITVARNGNKINGITDDAIIDVNQSASSFVYTGATVGWRFD